MEQITQKQEQLIRAAREARYLEENIDLIRRWRSGATIIELAMKFESTPALIRYRIKTALEDYERLKGNS